MRYKGSSKSLPEIARELGVDAVVEGSVAAQRLAGEDHGPADRRGKGSASLGRLLRARREGRPRAAGRGRAGHRRRDRSPADVAGALASHRQGRRRPGGLRSVPAGPSTTCRRPRLPTRARPSSSSSKRPRSSRTTPSRMPASRSPTSGSRAPPTTCFLPERRSRPRERRRCGPWSSMRRSAEPHAALAWVSFIFDRDWATAESQYRRPLELTRTPPTASNLSRSSSCGWDDSTKPSATIQHAHRLDPLSLEGNLASGFILHCARRDDEALPWFRRVLDMDSSFARAHWGLGMALLGEEAARRGDRRAREGRRALARKAACRTGIARLRLRRGRPPPGGPRGHREAEGDLEGALRAARRPWPSFSPASARRTRRSRGSRRRTRNEIPGSRR